MHQKQPPAKMALAATALFLSILVSVSFVPELIHRPVGRAY
jgi:hypothetical protein